MRERRTQKRGSAKVSGEEISRSLDELEKINVDNFGVDGDEFRLAWQELIQELRNTNSFLDDLELHLKH